MKTEEKRFRSDFKILIVGDSQSGKTSFCEKYTKDIFMKLISLLVCLNLVLKLQK